MLKQLLPALRATIFIAFLTGIAFPLGFTYFCQLLMPGAANGSLVYDKDGRVIGSSLLAQHFSKPEYFHARPSAAGSGYAGEASAGTNLGPTSAKLILGKADDPKTEADESYAGIKQLSQSYRKENLLAGNEKVPVDAVTRSGSGLDPDISLENALFQSRRVAHARNMNYKEMEQLVQKHLQARQFGLFGEARLNVLMLNKDLDAIKPAKKNEVLSRK